MRQTMLIIAAVAFACWLISLQGSSMASTPLLEDTPSPVSPETKVDAPSGTAVDSDASDASMEAERLELVIGYRDEVPVAAIQHLQSLGGYVIGHHRALQMLTVKLPAHRLAELATLESITVTYAPAPVEPAKTMQPPAAMTPLFAGAD